MCLQMSANSFVGELGDQRGFLAVSPSFQQQGKKKKKCKKRRSNTPNSVMQRSMHYAVRKVANKFNREQHKIRRMLGQMRKETRVELEARDVVNQEALNVAVNTSHKVDGLTKTMEKIATAVPALAAPSSTSTQTLEELERENKRLHKRLHVVQHYASIQRFRAKKNEAALLGSGGCQEELVHTVVGDPNRFPRALFGKFAPAFAYNKGDQDDCGSFQVINPLPFQYLQFGGLSRSDLITVLKHLANYYTQQERALRNVETPESPTYPVPRHQNLVEAGVETET